jgi:hypothetical protein
LPNAFASQAADLQARAEALERDLSQVILKLDPEQVDRLAQVALELGFTQDEMRAVFERAARPPLEAIYDRFGTASAVRYDLPAPTVAVQVTADQAITHLVEDLARQGDSVIDRLAGQAVRDELGLKWLTTQLRQQLALDEQRNRYVQRFERKLRTDPLSVLSQNQLRDRRFDRRLARGDSLAESDIAKMVGRYRDRMVRHRAITVARQELLRASNGAHAAAWENAYNLNHLPAGSRKFWWNMHDVKVRHSHHMIPFLNPGGVEISDSFVTPLGTLRYPLDPMGVAEDVIGCRCTMVFGIAEGA